MAGKEQLELKVQVHIYSRGPTGHIAWQFGDQYVSFNHGQTIVDLGSVDLPLPGGSVRGRAQAKEPKFPTLEQDEAKYVDEENPRISIVVSGCDGDIAGLFAVDLVKTRFPYVLWETDEIGSINCVTTSLMIFAVMLPRPPWPAAWAEKWGGVFEKIAASRKGAADIDWVGQITREPFPELMYVDQFREMIEDWQREQSGP